MIHFEQELKKFAIDLDKKQIEKEMKTNSKLARQVNDIINNIKGEQ